MEENIPEDQTNQTDLPQTPVAVGKKKVNLLNIVILLIVILLIGVGGVYAGIQISKRQIRPPLLSSPTPISTSVIQPSVVPTSSSDETANWKTYKNTEFGFSFKYDPKGTISSDEYKSIYGGREIAIKINNFDWFIEENKTGVLLDEFIKQNTNTTGVNVFPNKKIGKLNGTLAEFQGYQGQLDVDYAHFEFYFENKGVFNRLRLYLSGMDISAKDRENFLNILETVELY